MDHGKTIARWLAGAIVAIALLTLVSRGGETEVERLAQLLDIQPGDTVADVGAGDGWLSVEVAMAVGEAGHVFATELSGRRRDDTRSSQAAAWRSSSWSSTAS